MQEFSNAIAVLGVYFALMAVLAVAVEAVISWFKLTGPLQGTPSPDDVLNEVKGWLTTDEFEKQKGRITALNKTLSELGVTELKIGANGADIAKAIGDATTKYIKSERKRRAFIRLLAIGLGIAFAALFGIDTIRLLEPLLMIGPVTALEAINNFDTGTTRFLGFVLSGLAASAGSSYWHDQSARLRNLKTTSASFSEIVEINSAPSN